jgi:hypothetical protein
MDVRLGRRAPVGASADLGAVRRVDDRDRPAWCRGSVRDCRWALDEEVVGGAARFAELRAVRPAVAFQAAANAEAAFHQDAGQSAGQVAVPDEEVAAERVALEL